VINKDDFLIFISAIIKAKLISLPSLL